MHRTPEGRINAQFWEEYKEISKKSRDRLFQGEIKYKEHESTCNEAWEEYLLKKLKRWAEKRAAWEEHGETICWFCRAYLGGEKPYVLLDYSKWSKNGAPEKNITMEDIKSWSSALARFDNSGEPLTEEDLKWMDFIWGYSKKDSPINKAQENGTMYYHPGLEEWQTVCLGCSFNREIEDVFL